MYYIISILVGIAMGVVAEIIANIFGFWKYDKTVSPLINSLFMFGIIMGSISLLSGIVGIWIVPIIGFVIGYLYEWANFIKLHWWDFPGDKFLIFKGRHACALSVSLLWAIVPILIGMLSKIIMN